MRVQLAFSLFDSIALHKTTTYTQRTSGQPVVQSDPNINTADTQRLDTERIDYVAQKQAIRNMAPACSQLPLAATQSAPRAPTGTSRSSTDSTSAAFAGSVPSHSAQPRATPSFSRARVIPLPQTRLVKGRTGDISKYCSTPGSRYTGPASDRLSLARHQDVF